LAAVDAGRPQRQQTLHDTIAWSYELLRPALAAVFRRISVFTGGATLEALAAVAVTGGDQTAGPGPLEVAAELQDLSLITVTEGGERAATGMRLVRALAWFWFERGHAAEGRRWLEQAIELAADDTGAARARLAHGLGILLATQGELGAALRVFERSLAVWRALGDRDQQAKELNSLGIVHRM